MHVPFLKCVCCVSMSGSDGKSPKKGYSLRFSPLLYPKLAKKLGLEFLAFAIYSIRSCTCCCLKLNSRQIKLIHALAPVILYKAELRLSERKEANQLYCNAHVLIKNMLTGGELGGSSSVCRVSFTVHSQARGGNKT